MRVLLETENALVGFDETKRAMIVLWSGFGDFDEFSSVYNNVLKGFKIFFANVLINDMGDFGELSDEYRGFLTGIFPMLGKCGMRKFISINMSKDDQQKLTETLDNLKNKGAKSIKFLIENSLDAACEKIPSHMK